MIDEIRVPNLAQPITWKFPDAPKASVTCNDGYKMRSWFDIEEIPVTVDAKDYPDGKIILCKLSTVYPEALIDPMHRYKGIGRTNSFFDRRG